MLEVSHLSIAGILHGVSLHLGPTSRLGLIGESGSGKSMTALSIMGLLPPVLRATGSITFQGEEILGLPDRRMRKLRGRRIAMVFQEPMTALDPLMTVGRQVAEAAGGSAAAVEKLFDDVQLPRERMNAYPHELSGGQRQRVLIAMAIAGDPDVLICDEPTTALDVTVQDQILSLLERLARERTMALLFVTHDLGVIARMCDEVAVMRDGHIVEHGSAASVLRSPSHEYTRALVAASLPGAPARIRATGEDMITIDHASRIYGERTALDDVSLRVARGERLGIVGGSGSGKTTLLKIIAGLDSPTSGSSSVDAGVQMVFQDPHSSLNPRLRVGRSVAESCGGDLNRVREVLAEIGLPADAADRFPHEFSGGQRQRISIARAVAPRPDILLADEPVSALDVSVRAQVLEVLESLVEDYGLTLVFVSHDLSVVRQVCSTVAVMHEGRLVEHGPTEEIWANPQHEYTRTLLQSVPTL